MIDKTETSIVEDQEDHFAAFTKVLPSKPSIFIGFHTSMQAADPERDFSHNFVKDAIWNANESGYLIPRPDVDDFKYGDLYGSLKKISENNFAFAIHTPPFAPRVYTVTIYPMDEERARYICARNEFGYQAAPTA
jgi:hypothetical protein